MILEATFSRILVPTCLNFGLQVEAPKVDRIEFKFKISARGFQEAPRASQEGPRASRERPKSVPRAAKTPPRASKTHPSDAQDSSKSPQKQPRAQNQGSTLQNHRKIVKNSKNHRKYKILEAKRSKVDYVVVRGTKVKQMIEPRN